VEQRKRDAIVAGEAAEREAKEKGSKAKDRRISAMTLGAVAATGAADRLARAMVGVVVGRELRSEGP
jgi:hypothetical protein